MSPVALAIAATDPTCGAGVFADVKTFAAHGVYALAAVTATTVQSRAGVSHVLPLPGHLVAAQIAAACESASPAAVKVGMLATADVVRAVDAALGAHVARAVPIVVDPVLASSGGVPLLDAEACAALVATLLQRATIFTPNLAEASALTGDRVATREDMVRASMRIGALGPRAVLVKGGHLSRSADDLLYDAASGTTRWLPGERVVGIDLHGTGCALSSAIAAHLAKGRTLLDAVQGARVYVRALLERGSAVEGPGRALPDHLAPFQATMLGRAEPDEA